MARGWTQASWQDRVVRGAALPSSPTGEPKRGKYNARKKEVDGVTFDSSREAARYVQLKAMQLAGQIACLTLQPSFVLQDAVRLPDGKLQRAITYRADFEYRDARGERIIEDVKGMKTPVYLLKLKMLRAKYPSLNFQEVR